MIEGKTVASDESLSREQNGMISGQLLLTKFSPMPHFLLSLDFFLFHLIVESKES